MPERTPGLYDRICSFENIWRASRNARLGKRTKSRVLDFEFNLEHELFRIRDELAGGVYEFGPYRRFMIHEPKERIISAAPYTDRVVHHALCNVIEPILDRAMIYDTYACRLGKGSHRAIERAQHFLRGSEWVLKLDIKKYFFTVDHELLLSVLDKKIRDERTMELIRKALRTYRSPPEYYILFNGDTLFDYARPRGLPIGNLTSQLFANYYLARFDRFVKEELKCRGYLRYMDDCLLFSDSRAGLARMKGSIADHLAGLRLEPHERKTQIFPAKNGIGFPGFHLYPYSRKILRSNLQRFKRRMRNQAKGLSEGSVDMKHVLCSLNAWLGFADRRRNGQFIDRLLSHIAFPAPWGSACFTFTVV